ncbi:MAG TPA: hypothetical protein VN133_05225 [Humibacter sp.]|nr:hypothetical protein [Humibacter sp.]
MSPRHSTRVVIAAATVLILTFLLPVIVTFLVTGGGWGLTLLALAITAATWLGMAAVVVVVMGLLFWAMGGQR